jgi:hypothetical protein
MSAAPSRSAKCSQERREPCPQLTSEATLPGILVLEFSLLPQLLDDLKNMKFLFYFI